MSELCNTQPTHFSSYDGSLLLCPTIPSTDELPETRRGAVTPLGTQPIVVEWGFDPSVLIPKSVSPTTELWCFTHVSLRRLRLSDCSGTSPSLTTPVAPFQKEASANTDAASFVPVTGGSSCHSAGKCLSTKAIFNPRLKALRASALEGTLEP